MRVREVIIGNQIFLEIVVEAPERPEEDEETQSGVRIGELVPDSYVQM